MSSITDASTIPTVDARATLGEVARRLRAANAEAIVVLDRGTPVGLITEQELVDAVAASRHPDHGTAASWMRTDVVALATGADAATHRLPDTDASGLVGSPAPAAAAQRRR